MTSGTPGLNTLVMNIETDGNINLAAEMAPGSKYRSNPKIKEWDALMDTLYEGWRRRLSSTIRLWNGTRP